MIYNPVSKIWEEKPPCLTLRNSNIFNSYSVNFCAPFIGCSRSVLRSQCEKSVRCGRTHSHTPVLSFQLQCGIEGDKVLLKLAKPQYQYLCTVARRNKTLPREYKTRPKIQRHFPESKTRPRIEKHFPESKNTSKNPKHFWILGSNSVPMSHGIYAAFATRKFVCGYYSI